MTNSINFDMNTTSKIQEDDKLVYNKTNYSGTIINKSADDQKVDIRERDEQTIKTPRS